MARQLGLFDATMLVMGGIIGAGIFMKSLRGRATGAYVRADPWGMDFRRHYRSGWRIHLGGTCRDDAGCRGPICGVSSRRVPPDGRVSVRLGIVVGGPNCFIRF